MVRIIGYGLLMSQKSLHDCYFISQEREPFLSVISSLNSSEIDIETIPFVLTVLFGIMMMHVNG
jgi:hypothetical protein